MSHCRTLRRAHGVIVIILPRHQLLVVICRADNAVLTINIKR